MMLLSLLQSSWGPNTNLEVREFALNTMKGVKEENLVLALLNTYNMGKTEYYSLLNTMLDALGEFDDLR